MTKKISWQEVNTLRKTLQEEIVSLLKERNITELQLEFDEDSQSPTYVVDYCHRYDAWYEKQVTAVGICEDGDWYLKVYDNQEDEHSTIYASETNQTASHTPSGAGDDNFQHDEIPFVFLLMLNCRNISCREKSFKKKMHVF